ncbi:hypothetical protein ACQKQD_18765 [Methylobacterium sp. NPDC080182]|uniref:hypothetical protein n=1 Tax=Methylobacterium sp. NPDC080182 TaxID=3390590 RepID=UPI003D0521C3
MIDFTLEEVLELARQAELQKRVEADGVKAPEPEPVTLPEDLRGKLGEAEAEGDSAPAGTPEQRD